MKCKACAGTGKYKEIFPCYRCNSKGHLTRTDEARYYTYMNTSYKR